jgi:hypothetical protein
LRSGGGETEVGGYRFPERLFPFRLATAGDFAKLPAETHAHLVAINKILQKAHLQFGYRAANEIALFMGIYNELLPPDPADAAWLRALDAAVLQKILPRLQGNRAKLEQPLAQLCSYLRDLAVPGGAVPADGFNAAADARLRKAYRRAVDMLDSLSEFGFVSFFK